MSVQFKDFGKDSKDLLSKNFASAGKWTVEGKQKAAKGSYIVNPTATNDGKFAADIEGTGVCGATVKLTVTPDDLNNLKATIGYTYQDNKLESVISRKAGNAIAFEASHSNGKLFNGRVAINEKVTCDAVELGIALAAMNGVNVGCDGVYTMKDRKCNWNVGAVAKSPCGGVVSVRTNQLRTATLGVVSPIAVCSQMKPRVAGQVDYDIKGKSWKGQAVLELLCPRMPGHSLKMRVAKNLDWAVSYVAKLPGQWTVAVSLDKDLKTGVVFTCS